MTKMRPFCTISASTFWKIHPDLRTYIHTYVHTYIGNQVEIEGYFLQVSHILAAVFPQVVDKPYIGANCITLYVFSSAMITRGD